MAPKASLQRTSKQGIYMCTRCALRGVSHPSFVSKRWIGMKYLAKVAAAEDQWQEKALRVTAGKEKSMLTILEERGLVLKTTKDRESFDRLLTNRRVGAYVGVDPTASSLHIGNLVPLMALYWMFLEGYHTVSLLGGATAKIGDPTDRLTTRKKEPPSVRTANMTSMHLQLKRLWVNVEACGRKYGYKSTWAHHRELTNNSTWWNKLTMLELLQILGPGMRMGPLLTRETVKRKMKHGDGMSYAEFSYPIMQAWDWWYMFHSKGVQLQIGGSDQFGNIAAGIDAIKYILTTHPDPAFRSTAQQVGEPVGFTVPLLTTATGEKFGKSADNAVWLDSDQTSSFDLYGYFLRTADKDVEKFLKMLTFMPLEEIKETMERQVKDPSKRIAQHKLALEVVELAHGQHNAKEAEKQHRMLFMKGSSFKLPITQTPDASARAGVITPNNRPQVTIKLPESLIYQKMFGRVVFAANFAASLSESRRLLNASGMYIGTMPDRSINLDSGHVTWAKVEDMESLFLKKYLVCGDLLMLRKGKHNVRIIQVVPDEEYVKANLSYPGMSKDWEKSVRDAIELKEDRMKTEKKMKGNISQIIDLIEEEK
ncbi:Tyrosine--tRNA ligase [Podosphaera aphanis]|nr:Tyrosine--tRNA ligase [Podosphaera aphanis]